MHAPGPQTPNSEIGCVTLLYTGLMPETKRFRLTLDRISARWNRQYPEIKITDVAVK
jgi:hypothetical protein